MAETRKENPSGRGSSGSATASAPGKMMRPSGNRLLKVPFAGAGLQDVDLSAAGLYGLRALRGHICGPFEQEFGRAYWAALARGVMPILREDLQALPLLGWAFRLALATLARWPARGTFQLALGLEALAFRLRRARRGARSRVRSLGMS